MSNREQDLIQKAIDGSLTNRERSRLEELLAVSNDFRTAYNSHRAVAEALRAVKPLDPPSEVHRNIMNAVDRHRYQRPQKARSLTVAVHEYGSHIRIFFSLRYLATFAAGAAVACLLLSFMYDWPPLDTNSLGGTMGAAAMPGSVTRSVQHDIDFAGGLGRVELVEHATGMYLALDLKSAESVSVSAAFGQVSPVISSISQQAGHSSIMRVASNQFDIEHKGVNRYIIETGKQADVPVSLTFTIKDMTGNALCSKTIVLP